MNISTDIKNRFTSILKSKHLLIYVYAVVIGCIISTDILRGNSSISQGLVLWIASMSIIIYINYKLYLSTNRLMMAFITYLVLPLIITLSSVLVFGALTGKLNMIIPFIAITCVYAIMFSLQGQRTKWSGIFLENIKISLDIVRTIFAIALGIMTVYYIINRNYTFFQHIILDYPQMTSDELKQLMQLLVQSLTFPFIILTSILRIITDWLLLNRKRSKG